MHVKNLKKKNDFRYDRKQMDDSECYITWPFISSYVPDTGAVLHHTLPNRPSLRDCCHPFQALDPPTKYIHIYIKKNASHV